MNYFRTFSGQVVTFSEEIPESIESAWEMVAPFAVAVWRPIALAGPWDRLPIIGHRSRLDILRDLSLETAPDELRRLHEEMLSLQFRYAEVGRVMPLTAVAA